MKHFENTNGISIKNLKEYVKNLPETNEKGEELKVFIIDTDNPNIGHLSKGIFEYDTGHIILGK